VVGDGKERGSGWALLQPTTYTRKTGGVRECGRRLSQAQTTSVATHVPSIDVALVMACVVRLWAWLLDVWLR